LTPGRKQKTGKLAARRLPDYWFGMSLRILLIRTVLAALLTLAGASAGVTQDLRGPRLAAASNFGQGTLPKLQAFAMRLGIRDFRDAVYWDLVERDTARFTFDTPETLYPDRLHAGGATMSLTVNNGHRAYDDGNTPTSGAAIEGFARHAAAMLRRFPAITAIEVGNEFNSANFVSGPLREAGLEARAKAHVALLRAVWTQAKAERPDIRIIGGGVHSIPTGYLSMLLDLGAADYMDSLALHPYSTPIEQLSRQIAVMRRLPGLSDMPIEITEFGAQNEDAAAGVFLRSYCQMALSGVSRAVWYAVNRRGDGYVPLIERNHDLTPAWQAFHFAQTEFEGRPVRDAAPDAFTYACLFDERKLVIWGMPRALSISPNLTAFDALGQVLTGTTLMLSETEPLVLIAPDRLDLTADISLGPQDVVADSYHQFGFSKPQDGAGFRRFVRSGEAEADLIPMPGQAREGRPWTPWLGLASNGDVRLLSTSMLPGGTAARPDAIVHGFTAPEDMRVDLSSDFTASARSEDGVIVTLRLNGVVLAQESGLGTLVLNQNGLTLVKGATLDLSVEPGDTARGDVTDYRITLRRAP
jgi:hypothetical protein